MQKLLHVHVPSHTVDANIHESSVLSLSTRIMCAYTFFAQPRFA